MKIRNIGRKQNGYGDRAELESLVQSLSATLAPSPRWAPPTYQDETSERWTVTGSTGNRYAVSCSLRVAVAIEKREWRIEAAETPGQARARRRWSAAGIGAN